MPDAWDDDWITKADTSQPTPASKPSSTKLSKAEKRAMQAEFNRQVWADAEDPQDNFFLRSREIVPLKSQWKPTVQVLSRKPKATPAAGSESAVGIDQMRIDDDEDSEDEANKNTMTPQERQEKAARERDEKQKKYEEVRQKLFGVETFSTSGSTSPARKDGNSRNQSRNKSARESRPSSSASTRTRQLYDPNDNGKQGANSVLKKDAKAMLNEVQPVRSPRNPDPSYRGGYGFAPRGGRSHS